MRAFKVVTISLALAIAALLTYGLVIYPRVWYRLTRRESIALLGASNTHAELTNAVGYLGLFIPLTNNAWIAIRYRDIHSGSVQSCAVARDSGGEWFESDRHFCGAFQAWPVMRDAIEAMKEDPALRPIASKTNANGIFPAYSELIAIESAPNLESARRALVAIGFKRLDR